ncbi:MAG: Trm112 family protein [Alphaproteobacteria bacterium]|nr:Trm112 family protein [Alphaproteobacteria bacterium]
MTDQPKTGDTKSEARADTKSEARADPKLLEILVCPVTKASLTYDAAAQELISKAARLAYPIRGGIPIMLPDEARQLSDDEMKA